MPPGADRRIRTYTDLRASVSRAERADATVRSVAGAKRNAVFVENDATPRRGFGRWMFAGTAVAALVAWTLLAAEPARLAAFAALAPLPGAAAKASGEIEIDRIQARQTEVDGQTILYIDGALINKGKHAQKAPGLVITIVGDDDRPLYSWTSKPAKPRIEASRETPFQARLLSPPERFKSISVALAKEG